MARYFTPSLLTLLTWPELDQVAKNANRHPQKKWNRNAWTPITGSRWKKSPIFPWKSPGGVSSPKLFHMSYDILWEIHINPIFHRWSWSRSWLWSRPIASSHLWQSPRHRSSWLGMPSFLMAGGYLKSCYFLLLVLNNDLFEKMGCVQTLW